MGMILKELTGAAEPSEMVVQGIAQALAVHLVRQYGKRDSTVPARRGALPAFKLQLIVRMMEAGLDQAFNLKSLAAEAGLSAFHFSRVFKQSTGSSPSDYFIQLKMAEARRLLRETEASIIQIALDLGYSSPAISRRCSAGRWASARVIIVGRAFPFLCNSGSKTAAHFCWNCFLSQQIPDSFSKRASESARPSC